MKTIPQWLKAGMLGLSLTSLAPAPLGLAVEPDNSKVNQRDDGVVQPTADQQPNNRSDEELTRRIRSALIADKSLSVYGHNVKIITQNGHVLLRGPVRSVQEKRVIEQKALQVAGAAAQIENRIEVAPR